VIREVFERFGSRRRATIRTACAAHVDAAFNFARWLLRSRADAEDVAQEALLRACRFFRVFRRDARAWLLQIVRNTCYSWLEKIVQESMVEFDEELHQQPSPLPNPSHGC